METTSRPGSAKTPRWALAIVFAVVFVDFLGFSLLFPIIPLYAEHFGASAFVIGILLASYSVAQFIFAPVLGRVSDNYGRRPILLVSLAGSVIAWTLFGLANGLVVLFVARLVAGAMGGNVAVAQAYIADVTAEEDRAKGLGLIGAAFGLGMVFGPALGGIFSSTTVVSAAAATLPSAVPVTEFTLPSFAAAAISTLNLMAAVVVVPETRTERQSTADRSRVSQLVTTLATPPLNRLILSFFLYSLSFTVVESMLVLLTNDVYGYGPTMNGFIFAYVGIVIAIVNGGLIGQLTPRYGEAPLAIVGAGLLLVTLASVPFAPALGAGLPSVDIGIDVLPLLSGELVALLAILTVLAVGEGLVSMSLQTLVSTNAPADTQGGTFGLTQSAASIAQSIGPIAAGALYTGVAYWAPFVIGGLLMLPIISVLVMVVGERRRVSSIT